MCLPGCIHVDLYNIIHKQKLSDTIFQRLPRNMGTRHIYSPSAFSRRAVVSYWRKCVHEVLVNRLGGLSLPRKSVVRLTDRPDMTLDVYRGRKTTMQQPDIFKVNRYAFRTNSCTIFTFAELLKDFAPRGANYFLHDHFLQDQTPRL